jgi:hypothetical protein
LRCRFDLSDSVSDDANDVPPFLASILHDLNDDLKFARFIRNQAVTQGLSVVEKLNSGVR